MIEEKKQPAIPVFTVRDVIELIFRGKWIIVFFTFLGFLAAATLYFITPSVYRSEAKLLIRYVSDTTRIEPDDSGENIRRPDRDGESIINSELEILTSQDLIETVIRDIGPEQFASIPPPYRTFYVMQNLHAEVPKKSSVIQISFYASNPELAQAFLSKLIEQYLRKHVAIHSELGDSDILLRQTDQMRARLAETEQQLRRLLNSAGVISVADAKISVARRVDLLKQDIQEAEVSLAAAQARLDLIQSPTATAAIDTNMLTLSSTVNPSMGNVETSAERNNRISAIQLLERLREQQQRETAILAVYTADSQPVRSLRLQIEETRKMLASLPLQEHTIANMGLGVTNLQSEMTLAAAEVVSLKAKIKALKECLGQTRIEAQQIDKGESDIMEFQRNKEIQEVNYRYFAQSLEKARIDNTLNAQNFSNISIVQYATLPSIGLRPKLSKKMTMAVALGLFCGLGISFLKGWVLNKNYKRLEDLEAALRIPVLVSIPYIDALNGSRRNRVAKHKRKSAVATGDDDSFSERPIWNIFQELEDYFETIKVRLLAATRSTPEKPCMVAFTGCFSGAGVTTFATGLALKLANDGDDRVLLVDANFGEPMAHKLLGMDPSTGLAGMPATGNGEAVVVQRNLYFMPSGWAGEEMPGKDFLLPMANVVRRLKEQPYRFVLFDTAAITNASVALRICHMMDSVILVIDADKTDRAAVARTTQILNRGGDRVMGIVFNRKRIYTPRWLSLPT